jgi:hypothetical protein
MTIAHACSIFVQQIYAVLWHEQLFPVKILTRKIPNFLGATLIRAVNLMSNKLTGFDRRNDPDFQKSHHVYPGDFHCNIQQPHSKWHEITGNGLVDVDLSADSLAKVIAGEQLPLLLKHDIFQCYEERDAFSDFSWPTIAPAVSEVFDSCFSNLLDGWPQLDTGGFVGCMVTSIIRFGNDAAVQAVQEDGLPPTFESCLVEHDCIRFDGLQLDGPRLKRCIGLRVSDFVLYFWVNGAMHPLITNRLMISL